MFSYRDDKYQVNWSENIKFSSSHVLIPETVSEVQEIVKSSKFKHLKVFGTRHCFSKISDASPFGVKANTAHISLEKFTKVVFDGLSVKFGAGMTYSNLIKEVDAQGLAIENLPSLPHINVVGGMITATHGSGINHRILANMVTEFDIVLADGTLKTFSKKETPNFSSYLINFGSIGVITAC